MRYSIREAAAVLGVCYNTMRQIIKQGKVPYHKINSRVYFTDEDIAKFDSCLEVKAESEEQKKISW